MLNNNIKNRNDKLILNDFGKIIGWVESDSLNKNISSSKHMLLKPKGIAWDFSVLERARKENLKRIYVHDKETGNEYEATLEDIFHYGVRINRGFGEQIVLPLKYWQKKVKGQPSPSQLALPL